MPSDKEVAEDFIAKQDAATDGPWNTGSFVVRKPGRTDVYVAGDELLIVATCDRRQMRMSDMQHNPSEDSQFIAHARNSTIGHRMLDVVKENERLRAQLSALSSQAGRGDASLAGLAEENLLLREQLAEAAEHIKEIVENGPDEQYLDDAPGGNAEYYVNLREFLKRITKEQDCD